MSRPAEGTKTLREKKKGKKKIPKSLSINGEIHTSWTRRGGEELLERSGQRRGEVGYQRGNYLLSSPLLAISYNYNPNDLDLVIGLFYLMFVND